MRVLKSFVGLKSSILRDLNYSRFCFARKFSTSKNGSNTDESFLKVANLISKSSREDILVMVGAGLSTASGIPDFRTPGTGLYDNLQKYNLPYPEAIFDINYFVVNPLPFYALAKDLYPGKNYHPNLAHYFLNLLNEEGKLKRVYTQNIDGLERLSGLAESKLVECHGSFASSSCTLCQTDHPTEKFKDALFKHDDILICNKNGCKGKVKPNIVFFGENLPESFYKYEKDIQSTNLLMVLGTSLEVYPFAGICDSVPESTQRVLINRDVVGSFGSRPGDICLCGDIVEIIDQLTNVLNLNDKMDVILNRYGSENQ